MRRARTIITLIYLILAAAVVPPLLAATSAPAPAPAPKPITSAPAPKPTATSSAGRTATPTGTAVLAVPVLARPTPPTVPPANIANVTDDQSTRGGTGCNGCVLMYGAVSLVASLVVGIAVIGFVRRWYQNRRHVAVKKKSAAAGLASGSSLPTFAFPEVDDDGTDRADVVIHVVNARLGTKHEEVVGSVAQPTNSPHPSEAVPPASLSPDTGDAECWRISHSVLFNPRLNVDESRRRRDDSSSHRSRSRSRTPSRSSSSNSGGPPRRNRRRHSEAGAERPRHGSRQGLAQQQDSAPLAPASSAEPGEPALPRPLSTVAASPPPPSRSRRSASVSLLRPLSTVVGTPTRSRSSSVTLSRPLSTVVGSPPEPSAQELWELYG